MNISDFIPYYPEIYDYDPVISREEKFEENVFLLKEFNELKLKDEQESVNKGELLNHQKFVSRYLSNVTKYDRLLLFHSPGTGKTCASIGLIENIRRLNSKGDFNTVPIKGAIIIAKNTDLLQNYKNELVFRCTRDKYLPEDYESLTVEQKKRRINKKVKEFYRFETMQTFSDTVAKYKSKELKRRFSGYVFVIDEVHNIPFSENEKKSVINILSYSKMYKEFSRLFDSVEKCKVLLMTGTPMKDTIDEFPYVMNLLLPLDNKFDLRENFTKSFFIVNDNGVIINIKDDRKDELVNRIRGKISYLKTSYKNTIPKKYVGSTGIHGLNTFIVDTCQMTGLQKNSYQKIYVEEVESENRSSFRMGSRQASLFVFPDGTSGKSGFEKFVVGKRFKLTEKDNRIVEEITKDGIEHDKMLKNLKNFSIKYYKVIQRLLLSLQKKEKSFVYCEFVHGSGIILFSYLLELFGFSRSNISSLNNATKAPRYLIITSSKYLGAFDIAKNIKLFNDPRNFQGEYINVVLGSGVISEGYTFKDIQHEHILTPYWNYSELDQIIARGWRLNSHKTLLDNNINPTLNIYQYVSIPDEPEKSIDVTMYRISEIKDKNIKFIEYIIKKNTVDCQLFYDRNRITQTSLENARECEYKSCNYKCDNFNIEPQIILQKIQNTNYNIYYPKTDIITELISTLFKKKFQYNLKELLEQTKYTSFEMLTSLNHIISQNIPIRNKYGFINFLREENDIYFLIDDINTYDPTQFSLFYSRNPKLNTQFSFSEELQRLQTLNVLKYIKSGDLGQLKLILLSSPIYIQQSILEKAIVALLLGKDENSGSRNSIIDIYKPFLFKRLQNKNTFVQLQPTDFKIQNTTIICNLYFPTEVSEKNTITCINTNSKSWRNCDEKILSDFKLFSSSRLEELNNTSYKHYGIVELGTGEFFIKNTERESEDDKRKINKGKRCINWKKHELVKLIVDYLNIPTPPQNKLPTTKNILRKKIESIKYLRNYVSEKNETFFTIEKMKSILYWYENSVKNTCMKLQDWFQNNNLILYKI